MAWDYALAHPDQFAGVVVISGLPAKYVPRYLPHHERLPLFYVVGDLVPAASSFIYEKYRQAADREGLGHHLRRVLPPRPGRASRGDRSRLRLDGPPPPRSVIPSRSRPTPPGPPTTASTAIVVREFSPGRTTAPGGRRRARPEPQPATIEMKIEQHVQPDPAGGERRSRVSTSGSVPSSSTSSADSRSASRTGLTSRARSSSNASRCSKTCASAATASNFTGIVSRRTDL